MSEPRHVPPELQALLAPFDELLALLKREMSESPPTYAGALRSFLTNEEGESDPLGGVGLGLGASRRARELVIKGLMWEHQTLLSDLMKKLQRGHGRPKSVMSINAQRALAMKLYARDELPADASQIDMIRYAVAREAEMYRQGGLKAENRLFGADESTLQKSVSAGMREIRTIDLDPRLGLDLTK